MILIKILNSLCPDIAQISGGKEIINEGDLVTVYDKFIKLSYEAVVSKV